MAVRSSPNSLETLRELRIGTVLRITPAVFLLNTSLDLGTLMSTIVLEFNSELLDELRPRPESSGDFRVITGLNDGIFYMGTTFFLDSDLFGLSCNNLVVTESAR